MLERHLAKGGRECKTQEHKNQEVRCPAARVHSESRLADYTDERHQTLVDSISGRSSDATAPLKNFRQDILLNSRGWFR